MILVTGGCGYIGSHVVKKLTELGKEVVVFDNLVHGRESALLHNEELIKGDIRNKEDLIRVLETHQIDTVMHFAALVNAAESNEKKSEYIQVNDVGSRNVWEVGSEYGVKHFLYASSAAVYGTPPSELPVTESDPIHPTNPYGETKLAGEQSLQELVDHDRNYLIFRFFNVGGSEKNGRLYQSRESRAIISRAFATIKGEDETLILSGTDYPTSDGTVVRDFVHVEDIVEAFILGLSYLEKGGKSEIINLGSGEVHTILEVLNEVEKMTQRKLPVIKAPRIQGDIVYSLASIKRAKEVLNWTPQHDLRDIIKTSWYSHANKLS